MECDDRDRLRRLVAFGAAGGWSVLGTTGGLLLARSLGGALTQPLPEVLILFLSLGVSLASLSLQAAAHWSTGPRRAPDWPEALAISGPILWGIPLLADGGAFAIGGVFSLWLIHAAAVLCVAWRHTTGSAPSAQTEPVQAEPVVADESVPAVMEIRPQEADDEADEEAQSDWPFGEDVDQWQTRSRWEGGIVVSGGILVEFPPGVRETVVHLTFCPPLSQPPELSTEELDGQGWDIRVAAALAWGGRLTVRRRGPAAEAIAGRIGYSAVCASSVEAA